MTYKVWNYVYSPVQLLSQYQMHEVHRQDHLNDLHRNETQSYSQCPQHPHPLDMKQSRMLHPSFRHHIQAHHRLPVLKLQVPVQHQ